MKSETPVLLKTDLPLPLFIQGKVRDTYDLGNQLLIVATDRISAFDVILPCGSPDKGKVLNQISTFWFSVTATLSPNHMIQPVDDPRILDVFLMPEERFQYPDYIAGRSMIVKKLVRVPVECVVRGYLAGSGWAEYQKSGTVCGIKLPAGLKESQELPEPIFTPTTKADAGHDMPMTMDDVATLIGKFLAEQMRDRAIEIYSRARKYAADRGIIIADTKMEFGLDGYKLVLIDELLTPDSSRFWEAEQYKAGQSQPSYDKQPVRDWLEKSGWNKQAPAPALPDEVIEATSTRYREAFERLAGEKLK
jgi:phosphoribosylaminoimidazole-succinocarboxamide synthase